MHSVETPEQFWQALLTGNKPEMPIRQLRHLLALLPGRARCKFCNAPFDGIWAPVMRVVGRGPSRLTKQLCNKCQVVATKHIGGAQVDVTLLFADVRGSTELGERLDPTEFSRVISHFFAVASRTLLASRAWVDRLAGDQVVGIYLPFFAGQHPERSAWTAARALLRALADDLSSGRSPDVGIGIHSGKAFIGTVGSCDSATDITVLGDVPNVAARLASAAKAEEILISQASYVRSATPLNLKPRSLTVKGKSQSLTVYAWQEFGPARQCPLQPRSIGGGRGRQYIR